MAAATPDPGLVLAEEKPPIRIDADGTARIARTRVTLDTVVHAYLVGVSAEEIARQYPSLSQADVYGTLAYYLRYRSEVEACLSARAAQARQVREEIETEFDPAGVRDRLLARRRKK